MVSGLGMRVAFRVGVTSSYRVRAPEPGLRVYGFGMRVEGQGVGVRVEGRGFGDESHFSGWSDLPMSISSARARVYGFGMGVEGRGFGVESFRGERD